MATTRKYIITTTAIQTAKGRKLKGEHLQLTEAQALAVSGLVEPVDTEAETDGEGEENSTVETEASKDSGGEAKSTSSQTSSKAKKPASTTRRTTAKKAETQTEASE